MKEMNKEMELNMKELEQVNGGGYCIGWGINPESLTGVAADGCFIWGKSAHAGGSGSGTEDTNGIGGTACFLAIFGVGLGANKFDL